MADSEPPRPLPANLCEPPQNMSLATVLSQLKDLIFKIKLAKMKAAKSATLVLDTLYHAHDLIVTACLALTNHFEA